MKSRILVVVVLLLGFLVPMAALAKGGARAAIDAGNKAWMAAVEKGDAAAVAAAYTADARLLPPNHDSVSGQKDIRAFFDFMVKSGTVKKITLETTEVFDGNDTAAEIGKYTVLDGKGQPLDTGKYIVVWKNEGGKWKLHRDAWNSDATPPAAAAPAK
jgi:uncharacterized protein (TIGR02246 family)